MELNKKQQRQLIRIIARGNVTSAQLSDAQAMQVIRMILHETQQYLKHPEDAYLPEFYRHVLAKLSNELLLRLLESMYGTDFVVTKRGRQDNLQWVEHIQVVIMLLENNFKYLDIRRDLNQRIAERSGGEKPLYVF